MKWSQLKQNRRPYLKESQISWHSISNSELDNIPRNQFASKECIKLPIPNAIAFRRHKFFQSFQRLLRPVFLQHNLGNSGKLRS